MPAKPIIAPEPTAVRVALWRALHLEADAKPPILADEIGMKLVAEVGWRDRPDMEPQFSKSMRASIVARARFIEDLVLQQMRQGITQYVILGAGLDTFAQRHPEIAARLQIFEVDQPGPQAWKQKRLIEIGFSLPPWLHFVAVDFEAGQSWWEQLLAAGFNQNQPAIVVSTGVSMYLSREANMTTLRQLSKLARGSTYAMTFLLSLDLLEPAEQLTMEFVMKKAKEGGTPFISLFAPPDLLALAKEAGFKKSQFVSANHLYQLYFVNRLDGLQAGSAEGFLVATT